MADIEDINKKNQENSDKFNKEFPWVKDNADKLVTEKLWKNFEWNLEQAWWKAFDELTQWKFWAMDPKKQEILDVIKKSILDEAWNDPKKMISLLTEAKNIIETAEWSAANKNQADLDKSKKDIQTNNDDTKTWKDSLSKMRTEAIAVNQKNSEKQKEANNAWKLDSQKKVASMEWPGWAMSPEKLNEVFSC
jgi:hypothetical protein